MTSNGCAGLKTMEERTGELVASDVEVGKAGKVAER